MITPTLDAHIFPSESVFADNEQQIHILGLYYRYNNTKEKKRNLIRTSHLWFFENGSQISLTSKFYWEI